MKAVFGVAGLALSLAGCVERYNIRPTQLAELNEGPQRIQGSEIKKVEVEQF